MRRGDGSRVSLASHIFCSDEETYGLNFKDISGMVYGGCTRP